MREHAQTGKLRTVEQGLIRQSNANTYYQLTEETDRVVKHRNRLVRPFGVRGTWE